MESAGARDVRGRGEKETVVRKCTGNSGTRRPALVGRREIAHATGNPALEKKSRSTRLPSRNVLHTKRTRRCSAASAAFSPGVSTRGAAGGWGRGGGGGRGAGAGPGAGAGMGAGAGAGMGGAASPPNAWIISRAMSKSPRAIVRTCLSGACRGDVFRWGCVMSNNERSRSRELNRPNERREKYERENTP